VRALYTKLAGVGGSGSGGLSIGPGAGGSLGSGLGCGGSFTGAFSGLGADMFSSGWRPLLRQDKCAFLLGARWRIVVVANTPKLDFNSLQSNPLNLASRGSVHRPGRKLKRVTPGQRGVCLSRPPSFSPL
jgi:hypothetical protein